MQTRRLFWIWLRSVIIQVVLSHSNPKSALIEKLLTFIFSFSDTYFSLVMMLLQVGALLLFASPIFGARHVSSSWPIVQYSSSRPNPRTHSVLFRIKTLTCLELTHILHSHRVFWCASTMNQWSDYCLAQTSTGIMDQSCTMDDALGYKKKAYTVPDIGSSKCIVSSCN